MIHRLIGIPEANERLRKLVVGDSPAGFETGDVWSLRLLNSDLIIRFQKMSSTKESIINQSLRRSHDYLFDRVDNDEIGWATILAGICRRNISAATVDSSAAMTLTFEGGVDVIIRTDTDIVDWQWCITQDAANPYTGKCELACIWRSEVSSWSET